MKNLFVFLGLAVLASSCEITVKDGIVPREYQTLAQAYVGSYAGSIDGNKGAIEIKIENDRAIATWTGVNGAPVLNGCQATIGRLLRVDVDEVGKGKYELDHATFALDTSACERQIHGNEIKLDFKHRTSGMQIKVSILEEIRNEWVCRMELAQDRNSAHQVAYNPGDVLVPDPIPEPELPRKVCDWEDRMYFIYGRLQRR